MPPCSDAEMTPSPAQRDHGVRRRDTDVDFAQIGRTDGRTDGWMDVVRVSILGFIGERSSSDRQRCHTHTHTHHHLDLTGQAVTLNSA